ncbi:chemotaxis protein CheD [Cytobacillus kochii]|uniref:chemotaxis protein CheD n=1 Tax=Cytobacillus kochii TaxID=859143 RepID=UPI0025A2246B|nr:chemotaxis protein CheD [Cytobacillus kochii]MDM5207311.1 chemotaxis protein CheD [Cytobacillus kochii]
MNTSEVVKVGIADCHIVQAPQLIRTSGLGSCVGVVLYDQKKKIAGLVHIMLPDSSLAKSKVFNPAKFADSGIKHLYDELIKSGAHRISIMAKYAGGAHMFKFSSGQDVIRIGERNIATTERILKNLQIEVTGKDVGGHCGRTIEFNPENGKMMVKTVNQGVTYI